MRSCLEELCFLPTVSMLIVDGRTAPTPPPSPPLTGHRAACTRTPQTETHTHPKCPPPLYPSNSTSSTLTQPPLYPPNPSPVSQTNPSPKYAPPTYQSYLKQRQVTPDLPVHEHQSPPPISMHHNPLALPSSLSPPSPPPSHFLPPLSDITLFLYFYNHLFFSRLKKDNLVTCSFFFF